MDYQNVFKRYELKYLLTQEQYLAVRKAMEGNAEKDKFFDATIRNVYYDTPDYLLIRRSLDKPVYKEKLRIRSYGGCGEDGEVFIELKKKYKSVVYKRRTTLPLAEAERSVASGRFEKPSQITNEIEYFINSYGNLQPAVYISYEREAYSATDNSGLRITFDRDILWREDRLSLTQPVGGSPLLPEGTVLMELKVSGALPLWMVRCLSAEKIYKTTFSKYGAAYCAIFEEKEKHRAARVAALGGSKIFVGEPVYV